MEKYGNLKKYMEKKGIKDTKSQEKKASKMKGFGSMKAADKWDIVEQIARDLGYIE